MTRRPFAFSPRRVVFCTAVSIFLLSGMLPALAGSNVLGLLGAETEPDKVVRLTVEVKTESGEPVSGAYVNVYDTYMLLPNFLADLYSPAYREPTNASGVAIIEIKVKSGDKLKFLIEVSREGMQSAKEELSYGTVFPGEISRSYRLQRSAPSSQTTGATSSFFILVVSPDQKPVQGAKVTVWLNREYFRKSYDGVTNSEGRAQIVTPGFDDFEVVASTDSSTASKTIRQTSVVKEARVMLTLAKETGTRVTVNVIDSKTRLGVSGAEVVLDGNLTLGYRTTQTDSGGSGVLTVPQAGNYSLRVNQEFYESHAADLTVAEGESKRIEIELKPKPKKSTGRSTITVRVLQADKFAKIEGGNLPFPGATVKIGDASETTNQGGYAAISEYFDETVEIIVEADGYKRQRQNIKLSGQQRYTGGNANVTVLLYPSSLQNVIEVRVVGPGKAKGSSVPMSGVTVTAGNESAKTRSSGQVTLKGDFGDGVEVSVEKNGFLKQTKRVNAAGGKATVSFNLAAEPDEAAITVTVLGKDPRGGSARPIAGAEVSANGVKGTTDSSGQASVTGGFTDEVDVTVSAKDHEKKTAKITLAKPSRTGSVEVVLEPIVALILVVDVRESGHGNRAVGDARVTARKLGTAFSSAAIFDKKTDAAGRAVLEMKGTAADIAQYRSGFMLTVTGSTDFLPATNEVPATSLQSTEPVPWTVYLTRDWTPLGKELDRIEPLIAALNNDVRARKANEAALKKLAADARHAESTAAGLLKEVEAFGRSLGGIGASGMNTAAMQCDLASRKIKSYRSDAESKERDLRSRLDAALTLSASCNTQAMADGVSKLYRDATALAREMNDLERNASAELRRFQKENTDTTADITAAAQKVEEIRDVARKASQYAITANTTVFKTDIVTRRNALSAELDGLKKRYRVDEYGDEIPSARISQIERMTLAIGQSNNVFLSDPDEASEKAIKASVANIETSKAQAERLLASFQAKTSCSVDSMEEDIKAIQAINSGNVIELAAAALDKKAEACIQKSKQQSTACQTRINEALFLMENGGPEAAATKIAEARSLGCDTGKIDEQLDYWKTIRDSVVYLNGLEGQCRFSDAANVIEQMPASIRAKPLMADQIERIRKGADALAKVITAESELLQNGRSASVERSITQAEAAARPVRCLWDRVKRLREVFNREITDIIGSTPTVGTKGGKLDWRPGQDDKKDSGGSADGRKCTANEAAVFSKMTGTWRTVMGAKVSIGGSCDNVTGIEYYTEYCENPDATHNKNLMRYQTPFKGSVRGSFLQVTWSNAFGNAGRKGTGNCYIGGDGVLSCSGLPCRVSGKKSP